MEDLPLCPRCNRRLKQRRGYCISCYSYLINKGIISKLEKPSVPEVLTTGQEQVLVGLMLGDGCLYCHKSTFNPSLQVQRGLIDKEYHDWTVNLFRPFVSYDKESQHYDKRTGKTYRFVRMNTRACSVFKNYYNQWYLNKRKRLPDNLELTPLTLAIWFADDGNMRASCSPHRLVMKLSTNGFTITEAKRLSAMLSERFNAYFGISLNRGQPTIISADAGSRAFAKEIDSTMPESMLRKAYWRFPQARFYHNVPKAAPVKPTRQLNAISAN